MGCLSCSIIVKVIIYSKRYPDGTTLYVEEVRTKHKHKEKAAWQRELLLQIRDAEIAFAAESF